MAKERNFNPVQAQRKADKAKAIKKGKSEVQNRRNEKLARRNPDRIQKQIDDLKAITTNGAKLSRHEEQVLEGLEKELCAVKKAREAMGDAAPSFGRGFSGRDHTGPGGGVLGKRRRGTEAASSDEDDDDVPEDVKRIPMPRDTPPPIPKDVMDAWWARRRARRQADRQEDEGADSQPRKAGRQTAQNEAPAVEARTVYEAKPVVRNLQKEAVSAFVPSVVRAKLDKSKGRGGLMEPEEASQLEKEGYLRPRIEQGDSASHKATVEEAADDEG
ncbi:hypothetical protein D7B24_007012 [Verticillium nonalfalfae]|uniref:Wbp11/ELF5/Saf1 N-terminal domain-containing protein n=1 Tax=Verticillium nonalfalfae TaxID=1051616 RepID=A0A3M9YAU4_9PEZI|nr:uncharacterized protein D7B24_007012 [Verticillium nonalfalfae]RNJ56648.1 hypothetical protein D7B24_007012 [Verticillium nonalfalfae]